MHGANRTGRPFTGDFAGILLYRTLHRFGFAAKPESVAVNDGLKLIGCSITNAVKCLPPKNKPETDEVKRCNRYLVAELAGVRAGGAVLALGAIAHRAVLLALRVKAREFAFAHGAVHRVPSDFVLFDSYHCSRYNTQTRRLTPAMFESVFAAIANHINGP